MTKLSVNINKIATLRNARGGQVPDVLKAALDCERWGAQGITVHPRPDERHIRRSDVRELATAIDTEFNIEGYPSPEFLELVREVRPAQVTLVPDAPDALTSNAGWNTIEAAALLRPIVEELKQCGIRVSLFIDADPAMAQAAKELGADRIEMYTEPYAQGFAQDKEIAVAPYVRCADFCASIGLGVNAGHDLSLENLAYFAQQVKPLDEVSIGHALICDALYFGLEETIARYLQCLR